MKYPKSGPEGAKLIKLVRLGLSHRGNHNFKHSLQDTLNALVAADLIKKLRRTVFPPSLGQFLLNDVLF